MRIADVIPLTAAALVLASCGGGEGTETGVVFGKREILVGGRPVTVEVALTPAQLEQGLKYRHSLPDDRGMLFVYSSPGLRPFWMKDTPIPLSIAFIDAEGKIINIRDMEPDGGEVDHWPERPFLWALEMNRGWFEENGIRPGDPVVIERRGTDR